jgi:hypothetical protein
MCKKGIRLGVSTKTPPAATDTAKAPAADADAKTKKQAEDMNKDAVSSPKTSKEVATVKWTDKDTLVITGSNGKPVTFKRKT